MMFNKACAVIGLVLETATLAVFVPAVVVSHVKSVKEKGKDFKYSYENTRDTFVVASVTSLVAATVINGMVNSIKTLKH